MGSSLPAEEEGGGTGRGEGRGGLVGWWGGGDTFVRMCALLLSTQSSRYCNYMYMYMYVYVCTVYVNIHCTCTMYIYMRKGLGIFLENREKLAATRD